MADTKPQHQYEIGQCHNRDFLDEKYDLISGKFQGMSYQSVVVILFSLTFARSWFSALLAFTFEGLNSAIAFGLAMYFPFVFMFLRLDVFRDENSRLVSGQKVIGYHPVFFYLLGFMLSRGAFRYFIIMGYTRYDR